MGPAFTQFLVKAVCLSAHGGEEKGKWLCAEEAEHVEQPYFITTSSCKN